VVFLAGSLRLALPLWSSTFDLVQVAALLSIPEASVKNVFEVEVYGK
jgi:hypothetical protein